MTDWRRRPWNRAGRPRSVPTPAPVELDPPTPARPSNLLDLRPARARRPPDVRACPRCGAELAGMLVTRASIAGSAAFVGQCRCGCILRCRVGDEVELEVVDESSLSPDEAANLAAVRAVYPEGGTTVVLLRCPGCDAVIRDVEDLDPTAKSDSSVGVCGGCGELFIVRDGACVKYDGELSAADHAFLFQLRQTIRTRRGP